MVRTTIDMLKRCIEYADKVKLVCNDVINGNNITNSCKNRNISLCRFRTLLRYEESEYGNKLSSNDILSDCLLTRREMFIYDLFDINYLEDIYIREDLDKAVEITFKELDKKESDVLLKYYFENKTLSEISREYNESLSCISRIKDNGIKHLRHPKRITYFIDGVEGNKRDLADKRDNLGIDLFRLESLVNMLKANINNLDLSKSLVNKLVSNNFTNLEEISKITNKDLVLLGLSDDEVIELIEFLEKNIDSKEILSIVPIERLGLSTRVCNILKRRGFDTIQKVLDCNINSIRGFGKTYKDELFSVLKSKGFI